MPYGEPLIDYIINGAQRRRLDPAAVLAVASQEGGFYGGSDSIGDHGTSFGPWQLHVGGALPDEVWARGATYAQAWAWSTTGIDYALGIIASVAAGLSGLASITNIVTRFERPLDIPAEIAGAWAVYGTYQQRVASGSGGIGDPGEIPGTLPGSPPPAERPGGDPVGGTPPLTNPAASAQDVSFLGDTAHFFKSYLNATVLPLSLFDILRGNNPWGFATDWLSVVKDFAHAILWLLSPRNILRMVEFIFGAWLIVGALALFAVELAKRDTVGGRAARAVTRKGPIGKARAAIAATK